MRKLLALAFVLALVPIFSPAQASGATLAQRVAKLEAKLKCFTRAPLTSFAGYSYYGADPGTGDPTAGPNGDSHDVTEDNATVSDVLVDQGRSRRSGGCAPRPRA